MSGGAGALAAGTSAAGFNQATDTENPTRQITAVLYDPEIRGYPIIADGSIAQVHPIDQEVSIRLTVGKGYIAGLPDVGRDLDRLKRVTSSNAQQVVEDDVNAALADLIANGSVRVVSVSVEYQSGRLFHEVRYVNLVASDSQRVRSVTARLF